MQIILNWFKELLNRELKIRRLEKRIRGLNEYIKTLESDEYKIVLHGDSINLENVRLEPEERLYVSPDARNVVIRNVVTPRK